LGCCTFSARSLFVKNDTDSIKGIDFNARRCV
jgi:hypothetical protein